jgi:hypothetical protein
MLGQELEKTKKKLARERASEREEEEAFRLLLSIYRMACMNRRALPRECSVREREKTEG